MNYKIIHDMPGRIRLRCGRNSFTKEVGYSIEATLLDLPFVSKIKTSHINGNILVFYEKGKKGYVLNAVKNLNPHALPVVENKSMEIQDNFKKTLFKMATKRFLIKTFLPLPLKSAFTIYRSLSYIKKGAKSLAKGKLSVEVLDATAISACLLKKSFSSASSIMFLLSVSDLLEDFTKAKTKTALAESLSFNIDTVWIRDANKNESIIPLKDLKVNDDVIIRSGSMIPIDGTVVSGQALVNEASMTGESTGVLKSEHSTVYAGTVVEEGNLVIKTLALNTDTRIYNIMKLIDNSENLKAGVQSRAEHLADRIVPFSFLTSLGVYLFTRNITKALSVLMVDYSCAIKLSTPISVISAIHEASNNKVLVKGGKFLEEYALADTIVFDKTGTLTVANPKLKKVIPFNNYSESEVLKISACLEEHFPHSVAKAIVKEAAIRGIVHAEEHAEVEYVVAHGISSKLKGDKALIGSAHFVFDDENIPLSEEEKEIIDKESFGYSSIFLAVGGKLTGLLCIEDSLRDDAKATIKALRKSGINNIVMLTGDSNHIAEKVANELNINSYKGEVLPEDKASFIEDLKKTGHRVIMVGDGINDSPALSCSNVSVSMKDSSDIAKETSDITLLTHNLNELVTLRELSKNLMGKINSNYRFIVLFNTALLLLGIGSFITPKTSALLHNLSTMGVSIKSTRPCLK